MKKSVYLLLFGILLSSCGNEKQNSDYSEEEQQNASEEMNAYFTREFEKEVQESPETQTRRGLKTNYDQWDDYSNLKYAEDLEQARERLDYLDQVDVAALDEDTRLSYDLYRRQVQNEIDDYDFRFYNYPIEQMHGLHAELPAFLINMHRIDSIGDARAYIARLEGLEKVMADVIEQLQLREQNGIIPPKFVFDRTLDASRNIIKGKPFSKSANASALLEDFTTKIDQLDLEDAERTKLVNAAEEALVDHVQPAYQSLIDHLENQQLRATEEAGVWKFPKGEEFYELALKRVTTTNLSAEEIPDGISVIDDIGGADGFDMVVLATAHLECMDIDWAALLARMRTHILYDGRRVLDLEAMQSMGWKANAVGSPPRF